MLRASCLMLEINVMRRKGRKVKRPAGTGYNYHGGLWGLVVVWLSLLSGWALATQARGVLGLTPGGCQPFHFPLFSPHNIYFQCEARCFEYIHDVSYSIYLDIPAYSWMKALWNNGVISNSVLDSPSWSWSCCMQTCDGYHLLLSVVHTEKMHLLVVCDPCTALIPGHYYIEYKLESIYKAQI